MSSIIAPRAGRDPRSAFRECFGAPRALVGMLHLGALPGTPSASQSVETLIQQTLTEARIYRDAGFTALAIENMHDRPYLKGGVGPEITAAMAAVARDVKRETGLVLGIQVLAAANREALAIAHASGADFVRVEGFVYAHVADEGVIESCAGDLLRYRRAIGADRVLVFADIKKKHSAHAITADVSIVETAKAAEFFLADGVIVTGAATGEQASPDEVRDVVGAVRVPVLVGSGTTPANLARFATAHGFIVGSSVKQGGVWCNPLDRDAVRALAGAFVELSPDR
jgi:membrane complex biogenesis BtpA family protein